ncbi:MAG TPA: arsenate reductase (azurin) large subunit [Candidatus Cybelea sp.]
MSVYHSTKTSVPLPPRNAERLKTVCHYCIVGCSYDVYKWPADARNGGPRPSENAFGVDFTKQQPPLTGTWISPEQHTIVEERDGRRYNVVIVPNKKASVNSGLASVRGGTLAASLYAPDKPTANRLHYPLVYRARDLSPTSWDDAVALVAGVVKDSIDKHGADSIFMKFFDHGGGGGGFENNWAVGKFFFSGVGTVMASIHNRPAYNSEVHGSRDMGVPELNNSYEDAELADTIVIWGANSYETQTNYFLNHMVPNLNGSTGDKKKAMLRGEPVAAGKMIVAEVRSTTTVVTARAAAGNQNVLHLWLKPGTDIALLNAIGRIAYERKWHDQAFIATRTEKIDDYLRDGLQTARPLDDFLAEAVRVTGVSRPDMEKAASWIAAPKAGGARTRTLLHYEKGMIWGLKNYENIASIVSLALLTGNVGKPGTGCSRLGGHQEGYVRPDYKGPRPAIYIDPALADGKGRVFWFGGCNPTVTTLNADRMRNALDDRGAIVSKALDGARGGSLQDQVAAISGALDKGGLFIIGQDLYRTNAVERAHVVFPAAAWGESPITSINGERRLRLYEKIQDPPGDAKPDWAIMGLVAQKLHQLYAAEGNGAMAARFDGFGWPSAEAVFLEGGKSFPPVKGQAGYTKPGPIESYNSVNYATLRSLGHDGIQTPVQLVGGHLRGTKRLFENGDPFRTASGKATFKGFKWPGYPAEVQAQMTKYPFFFTNGRINVAWQTMYNDADMPLQNERVPMAWIEVHPNDARTLGLESGDLTEVFNDYGSTNAVAYVTPSVKPGVVFMQFAHPRGTANSLTTPYVDPTTTIPYYKGSAVGLRKLGSLPSMKKHLSWIPVIETA